jgi:hypothetical protein
MIPCISSWSDLAHADIEVLDPGQSADGRWDHANGGLVVRLLGAMTVFAIPCETGIEISDAVLRSDGEGRMRWRPADLLGVLLPAPQDLETRKETTGFGLWSMTRTVVVPPAARDDAERLAVLRRAFSRALGPDAQARVAAFRALGLARLMTEGATSGILKPLEETPRILVHRRDGSTSTQALFPKGSARGRPLPDPRALLFGGACRQVVAENTIGRARLFLPCEEIRIQAPPDFSRHAMLAAADVAAERFQALGVDVSPWILRRGR